MSPHAPLTQFQWSWSAWFPTGRTRPPQRHSPSPPPPPPARNPPRTEFQRKQFGASSYPPGTLRAFTWTPAAWSETFTGVAYGSPPHPVCLADWGISPTPTYFRRRAVAPSPSLFRKAAGGLPSPTAPGLVSPLSPLPVHPALARHLRKKKKAKFLPKCTTTCALRCKNIYVCAWGAERRGTAKWFISNLSGFTRGFAQSRANG